MDVNVTIVEWIETAYKRAQERKKEKSAYTFDRSTGDRYWQNIETEIEAIKLSPKKEQIPPPPPNRRKAVIQDSPGKGDVIIYEWDEQKNPEKVTIRGVFPSLPKRIP